MPKPRECHNVLVIEALAQTDTFIFVSLFCLFLCLLVDWLVGSVGGLLGWFVSLFLCLCVPLSICPVINVVRGACVCVRSCACPFCFSPAADSKQQLAGATGRECQSPGFGDSR